MLRRACLLTSKERAISPLSIAARPAETAFQDLWMQIGCLSTAITVVQHEIMKSTTGYVFYLGGAAVSWRSRRQSVLGTSTAHAECNAAYEAACEAVFLRKLLADLFGEPPIRTHLASRR